MNIESSATASPPDGDGISSSYTITSPPNCNDVDTTAQPSHSLKSSGAADPFAYAGSFSQPSTIRTSVPTPPHTPTASLAFQLLQARMNNCSNDSDD